MGDLSTISNYDAFIYHCGQQLTIMAQSNAIEYGEILLELKRSTL